MMAYRNSKFVSAAFALAFSIATCIFLGSWVHRSVAQNAQNASDKVRAEVVNASKSTEDIVLLGKLELPGEKEKPLVLRFNLNAFVEFPADVVVPNSIRILSREELRNLAGYSRGLQRQFGEWFSVTLKKGAVCTIHYKTVKFKFTLDHSVQKSFYIDIDSLTVVYLEKKGNAQPRQIDCDNENDQDNMEVTVYTNRACCCSNNSVEAYGFVDCDDNWNNSDCFR